MRKLAIVMLVVLVAAGFVRPASALAADVCFKDQFDRVYGLSVEGVVGQAVEIFATLSIPSGLFAGTSFLTGGAYLRSNGKVGATLTGVGLGITMTLDPPSFSSGVGTQFSYNVGPVNGSQTGLTFTPAACLNPLP